MLRRQSKRLSCCLNVIACLLFTGGAIRANEVAAASECAMRETGPPTAAPSEAAEELSRGNALSAGGDLEGALAAYVRSEALARAAGDAPLATLAAASAARAAIDTGHRHGVAERLEAVLLSASRLADGRTRANLRVHVARSLARLGLSARAAGEFLQASEDARAAGDWRTASYADGYLGELYEAEGRLPEAETLSQRALFAAQRADSPDSTYRWQWQLGRIAAAKNDREQSLAYHRQAAATVAGDRDLSRAEVEPLYLALIDQLLDRAEQSESDERQALLSEVRDALEDLKASELRDYFRDPCLDARRKVAPEVIAGALVVYTIPLPDRLVLVVGKQGHFESHSIEVTREALVAEANAFRTTLLKRTTQQYLPHSQQLYEWLIRPVEPDLAAGGYDTLVFVPRGVLHTIPMAALRDSESNAFLIEKIAVAVTPSLALTDPKPIERGNIRVLFAGITESVQGFPELEFVGKEREALASFFPIHSLMNSEFVTDRFQEEISRQPFGIVHVASHGEFAADISQSYLLTYDGRLSMEKLATVVGTTRFREGGLELLTLSGCETAAGDEQAALGLAGVAIRAGAKSALATLWAVNDEASARLISQFYRDLSDPKLNRAQALQRAQIEVLHNRFTRHPGYWAPYLLISSWL